MSTTWRRTSTIRTGVLCTVGAFVAVGIAPAYPAIAHDLQISAGQLGLIVGLSSIVSALGQIPFGILADRGRTGSLVQLGVLLPGLALVLWGLAPNAPVFALGYAALGLGIPALQAGVLTAIVRTVPRRVRGQAMSLIWAASGLSNAVALVLLGTAGQHWRAAMLLLAIVPALAFVGIRLLSRGESRVAAAPHPTHLRAAATFLISRPVLPVLALTTLVTGAAVGIPIMIPFILKDQGDGSTVISLVMLSFLAGAVLGSPIVAGIADRRGPARSLGGLLLVVAACFAVTASVHAGPIGYAVVLIVAGAAMNGAQAVGQGLAGGLTEASGVGVGTALGVMRIVQFAGASLAASLVGVLLSVAASAAEIFVAGTSMIAATIALVLMRGHAHESPAGPTPTAGDPVAEAA